MTENLRIHRAGAILTVTLDRPDSLNAQLPSMWRAMAGIAADIDDDVRVVVVRGSGRSFSAGLDRRMFTPEGVDGEASLFGADRPATEDDIAAFQAGFTWLSDPRFVSVAVVQGHAIGAGFQLALACDLRIVGPDVQFSMAETGLGLVPDLGGTAPLVRQVGYSRALELCVTGRRVGADEAFALGLANVVVPADDLDTVVEDLCAALTAPLPGAVRATKGLLLAAVDNSRADQLRAEATTQLGRIAELVRTAGQSG